MISALSYLSHNLQWFEPDLVIHVIGINDADSGFGFVVGNTMSTAYDSQGVYGTSFMSRASPIVAAGVTGVGGAHRKLLDP